jgi:hypothetical protein
MPSASALAELGVGGSRWPIAGELVEVLPVAHQVGGIESASLG